MRSLILAASLVTIIAWPLVLVAEQNSRNVEAELLSEFDAIVPGEPISLIFRQSIRPGWHTYWRNPGDSGAPTELHWDLPPGFEGSELAWPWPERVPYGPLMNYGYNGEVLFPVTVETPPVIASDAITLSANGEWLVCADICIPESAEIEITLPVRDTARRIEENADVFMRARQRIPQLKLSSRQVVGNDGVRLSIALEGLHADRIADVSFFPFAESVIDNPSRQRFEVTGEDLVITVQPGESFVPGASLAGVVVVTENAPETLISAFEIVPIDVPIDVPIKGSIDIVTALLFALIGGMILNLMPCVFPVLSIKILTLVQHVGGDSGRIRLHGWVYLAGVVLSFIAVASVLIAFRLGGAQIGWGFQLQSPFVVAILAYLFVLVGLNLFGFFEIGTSIMNLGQDARHEGLAGSFFTGVLATVVAAPCTAPFMASAVGFALTQSTVIALAVFGALGIGVALPYLVLCYAPALLNRLPRPGPWMARFKEFLSFPMFASAIWLVWVLSQQAGPDGLLVALAGVLLLVVGLWLLKHLPMGTAARRFVQTLAMMLFAAAVYLPSTITTVLVSANNPTAKMSSSYEGPPFEPWTPARLAELRTQGPVFVNFTAAWCITCKVNERVAFDSARVKDAFVRHRVRYLKGDWTNEDAAITSALAEYQRSGVPLYLLYLPGEARAHVLPQVLTESIVLSAIEEI